MLALIFCSFLAAGITYFTVKALEPVVEYEDTFTPIRDWACPADGEQCNSLMCDEPSECLMNRARANFNWRIVFRGGGCE